MMVYVSHPFGGNKKNVGDTRVICKMEAMARPNVLFIPALNVTCRAYDDGVYIRDLKRLLELESKCDIVYMTGDWEKSKGCLIEMGYALGRGIRVVTTQEQLHKLLDHLA